MRHRAPFRSLALCLITLMVGLSPALAQDAPPKTGESGQSTGQQDSTPPTKPPVAVPPARVEPVQPENADRPRRDVPRYEYIDEVFSFDAEQPLVGFWRGNVETTLGPLIISVHITEGEAGLKISQTAAQVAPPHQECKVIEVDGRSVKWDFPPTPLDQLGWVNFEATVSEDGQWLEGEMVWPQLLDEPGTMKLQRTIRPRDGENKMAFGGTVEIEEIPFRISMLFSQTPGGNWIGHIDILDQRVAAWPLIRVKRDGDSIVATMGSRSPAVYDGLLSQDGQLFAGEYTQMDQKSEFRFERLDDYTIPDFPPIVQSEQPVQPEQAPTRPERPETTRTQNPTPPFPYSVENFFVPHPDGHVLGATVSIPEGEGPFPAAVLISGTGPQDRDQNVYNHKHFLVLSDYLTRQGIAVVRYDDRGVGQSTGNFLSASTATFATDAKAVYEYATTKLKRIDPAQVGLIGFDEGGLIAPMVANEVDGVSFVVLLGAPGLKGMEMQIIQTREELRLAGFEGDAVQPVLDTLRAMLMKIEEGAEGNDLLPSVEAYVQAQVDLRGGTPASAVPALARRQLGRLTSPWMRHFVTYDPQPALAELDMPVLALRGALDAQVAEENLDAIIAVMDETGGDLTAKTYPSLNHLFQPATRGDVAEYANIPVTFSEEVMNDIAMWIKEQVR